MAEINLIRVDSRLIHGQVITKWLRVTKANRIIIVDNQLAEDTFMGDIYAAAAPRNVSVEIVSVKQFMMEWEKNKLGEGVILLLLKDVKTGYILFKEGFPIRHLQLGGLPTGPGRTPIYKAVALDAQDISQLKEMNSNGIYIDLHVIPEDSKTEFSRLKNI